MMRVDTYFGLIKKTKKFQTLLFVYDYRDGNSVVTHSLVSQIINELIPCAHILYERGVNHLHCP